MVEKTPYRINYRSLDLIKPGTRFSNFLIKVFCTLILLMIWIYSL